VQKEPKIRLAKPGEIPVGYTNQGIVVEHNGKIVGYAAVVHAMPIQAVSEISDELGEHPRAIIKAVREFRQILKRYSFEVYAFPDKRYNSATTFLNHVGFSKDDQGNYRYG
jgi:hypothetical protein